MDASLLLDCVSCCAGGAAGERVPDGAPGARTHRKAIYATTLGCGLAGARALVRPRFGTEGSVQYLAAYSLEESLSIDNLFVFLLLFRIFPIPEKKQPNVLFWGVAGPVAMRGAFIAAGVGLLIIFTGSAMCSAGCC